MLTIMVLLFVTIGPLARCFLMQPYRWLAVGRYCSKRTMVSTSSSVSSSGDKEGRYSSKHTILSTSNSVSSGDKEEWFHKGLQFSCQMCGHCCSGSTGSVRFTDDEAIKMAASVKVSKEVFYQDYTRRRGSKKNKYYELKEQRTPDGDYDCIFLDRVTIPGKSICSLYDARPAQCRTWPFWEENLVSEKAWKAVSKGVEGCKGIGIGKVVPFEDIIKQRDETIALETEWNDVP